MLYVPGRLGKDLCDSQLGMTRRDIVRVGATSLHYLTLDGLQASTGLPRNQFCRACFDGDYPIAVPEEYSMCKMRFEKGAAATCEP